MFTLGTKQSTSFITNSGQSALEYMMTYGWAILIIVIVAVILYSMGIFTPSSSVSFSSSGFSPFTVSSSSCNSIGYKIAVIAGPIPNNANSLQITKVYVTSASGANTSSSVYTLPSPITLKSGQSAVIIVPNVACNAANVKYSFSAIIQYTYSVPSIGTQTINTSGTVAGTSIAGKPSILTSYEPLTITNTQTSATPSPFQQMVNMTSTDPGWSSIATSNFAQNVEFFYYNGSIIPSWLESYTTSGAIWWLKLPSISNSMVIYMGFAPLTTSLFNNVNTGEAPQLSATYGQYDDGAGVFSGINSYYNNFKTSVSLSNWGTGSALAGGNPNKPCANNGMVFNSTCTDVGITLPYLINWTYARELTYGYWSGTTSYGRFGWGYLPAGITEYIASGTNYPSLVAGNISGGVQQVGAQIANNNNNYTYQLYYSDKSFYEIGPTGTKIISFPTISTLYPSTDLAIQMNSGNAYWAYIAVATVPIGGYMPSVSFS